MQDEDVFGGLSRLIAELDRQGLLRIAVQLVVILIAALVALRLAQSAVNTVVGRLLLREATEGTAQDVSAEELRKRTATIRALGGGVVRSLILIIAALMALNAVNVDIGPAIAGLGIVGIAFGLGAQNLVRDYIAGSFILIENQYARGDVVKLLDVTGTVEDFTLRRTTVRDLDGTLHTVPNGLIGPSANLTRVWARINVDIVLPVAADLDRATQLVDAVGRALADDPGWRRRVLEAPRVARVEAVTGAGVTLKILGTVRAADRWSAAGELRRRILASFRENEIDLAG